MPGSPAAPESTGSDSAWSGESETPAWCTPPDYNPDDNDLEDLKGYRPGGFFPIHLGDYLKCGRFRVFHKLGSGRSATVWLCRDYKEGTWAAVRILKAELSVAEDSDFDPYQTFWAAMRGVPAEELKEAHLILPYVEFWESSANGLHQCFALPLLGSDISDLFFDLSKDYLPALVKHRCYQALEALDFLHSRDLCFGGKSSIFDIAPPR